MQFLTMEIEPDPTGARTYVVIVKHRGETIGQWQCGDQKQGEAQAVEAVEELAERIREENS